jgi:RNase adaptor protein for sRNA GlmZ degradation
VAAFLERQSALDPYWTSVRTLAEGQVETYLGRGFTSLSVAFGCTGGQHRSVYLAERLGEWLRRRFPQVQVRVLHREEPFWRRGAEPREAPAISSPAG